MATPKQNQGSGAYSGFNQGPNYPPSGNWPSTTEYGPASRPLADLPKQAPPDGVSYDTGITYYQRDPAKILSDATAATWNPAEFSGVFIPKIWSSIMAYKFHNATVIENIVNNKWEGELLEMGNSVIIRRTDDAHTFEIGSSYEQIPYQIPSGTQKPFVVNKCIGVAFANDKVLQFQSDMDYMVDYFDNASIQIANKIDKQVLDSMPIFSHDQNMGKNAGLDGEFDLGSVTEPVRVSKSNINDLLTNIMTCLNQQNIPDESMFAVIPPAVHNLIMRSDLSDASYSGDRKSNLRGSGYIGNIAGLDLYVSNQLRADANKVYNILFGHPAGVTFVAQMKEFEGPIVDVNNWNYHYRARCIYDFDATQREAIGHACVQPINL